MHKIKYMEANFWEFSLYFPRELLCYFEKLKYELKNKLSDEKNCVSISICDDNYIFLIAIDKYSYQKNILFIKESIADIILLYYKPKIIIESIKNLDMRAHDNVILIEILSSFDMIEDRNEIIKNLSLCNKLFLNSFVIFRLKNLISNWHDTGELVNQNSLFMADEKVKKELMLFLMDGLVSRVENIKIKSNGNMIEFKNENSHISTNTVFYSLLDYDGALFTLISNYPKKIEVEDYKKFDVHFIQNLYDLFGNRVKLLD